MDGIFDVKKKYKLFIFCIIGFVIIDFGLPLYAIIAYGFPKTREDAKLLGLLTIMGIVLIGVCILGIVLLKKQFFHIEVGTITAFSDDVLVLNININISDIDYVKLAGRKKNVLRIHLFNGRSYSFKDMVNAHEIYEYLQLYLNRSRTVDFINFSK